MGWASQITSPPSLVSLAVIGTAGRGADAVRLDGESFKTMVRGARGMIAALSKAGHPVTALVSGGAAYADHVAVTLFLAGDVGALTLHLPCAFQGGARGFLDTGARDWKVNPGGTSNHYHRQFQERTQIPSFIEIELAIERGARVEVSPGLFARNAKVALADSALAMTFGSGHHLKTGGRGTFHTMGLYLKRAQPDLSAHLDLSTGRLWPGACV
jgi:hypothetical protein